MTTKIHYKAVLATAEAFVQHALDIQILDPSDRDYGGFRCPELWICEPWVTANTLSSLAVPYLTPDSRYYHASELLERMYLALKSLSHSQHEDGTIDGYFYGNMRGASNIAFASHALLRAYRWLSREPSRNEDILHQIENFLRRGMQALKSKPVLDFHHRWVAAAALVEFDKFFADHTTTIKAQDLLNDGIDMNRDGIYSEQSPVYSMLSNSMLLTMAERLNQPALFEFVRRNLNFLLYTFHANGEVVTELSHHKAKENGLPWGYGVWKRMSIIDHNGYYAAAGDLTLNTYLSRAHNGLLQPCLNHPNPSFRKEGSSRFFLSSDIGDLLAIESEINNDWIARLPVPDHYEKVYPQSNLIRIRSGKMSATILGKDNNLFSLHNGGVVIDGFRIKYAYYGFRDYEPAALGIDGRVYTIRNEVGQWVYRLSPTRREVIPLNLQIILEIERIDDGFELRFTTRGWERIPLQIEFGLRKQGTLYMGTTAHDLSQTDCILIEKEPVKVTHLGDEIQIHGGNSEHHIYSADNDWTMNSETARLLINPMTPYNGRIRITCRSET